MEDGASMFLSVRVGSVIIRFVRGRSLESFVLLMWTVMQSFVVCHLRLGLMGRLVSLGRLLWNLVTMIMSALLRTFAVIFMLMM